MQAAELLHDRVRRPHKGGKKGTKLSKEHKDRDAAAQLMNFLKSTALRARNKKQVDPVRIAAAKAALPFLIPTLQSIEQTVHDQRDKMAPTDLLNQIKGMLASNPGLLAQLRDELNREHPPADLQADLASNHSAAVPTTGSPPSVADDERVTH